MKSALRRASTQPDSREASHGDTMTAKRSSTTTLDTLRRPSLATISRRLGRSKKPQSTSTPPAADLNRLGQLFFALPNELHALVLSFLSPQDILTLRLTCRTTNTILNLCAPTLLSVHAPQTLPAERLSHILSLQPPPLPNISLSYHLSLLRRHAVLTHTAMLLTSYMQMKIYMLPPTRQHQRITSMDASRNALLTSHLYPALWTIDHYLSTYRHLLLHEHPQHTSRERSRFWRCVPCGAALEAVTARYTPSSVVPAYHVMRLLGIHLKASSRAPSYAGTIERVVRRWSRRPAGEEELALVMLLGGMEVLRRVTVLKGTYNSRLEVLRGFLETVEEAVEGNRLRQAEREQREKPRVARMVVGKHGIERVELVVGAERQAAAEQQRDNRTLAGSKGKGAEVLAEDAAVNEAYISPSTATTTNTYSNESNSNADNDDPIAALSLSHRLVTENTLDQIPLLEDILLPQLRRRIEAEGLLDYLELDPYDRDEELETPYHWVRRVVCGDEEGVAVGGGGGGRVGDGEGDGEGGAVGSEDGIDGAHGGGAGAATEVVSSGGGTITVPVLAPWEAAAAAAAAAPPPPAAPQQQQQQGGNNGGRQSTRMFGSMSRHMLVTVGRDD